MDGTLLQDLDITVSEINNGSIFCSCQVQQFEQALTQTAALGPDLVFVEASGLSDPTSIQKILAQIPAGQALRYAGAVCLLDGTRFRKVYQTARVCRMQLAASSLILINKADLASPEQIEEIRSIAARLKPDCPVYQTSFGRIERRWLEDMSLSGQAPGQIHTRDITLQKLSLEISGFSRASLTGFLRLFAEDTYRIKGFADLPEGLFLVDCTGPLVELRPFSGKVSEPNRLAVLYGNGLHAKKSVQNACAWYPECTVRLS